MSNENLNFAMTTPTDGDLMDFVIISYGPDIRLLRHCLASYELYYQQKKKLFLFLSKSDEALLAEVKLPQGTTIVYKDDIPELATANSGVVEQIYLKLIAHRFVTTDFYCIIDSDFLFLRPTGANDFFVNGKPIWYYTDWIGHEQALRWRSDSERFLGFKIPYLFMGSQQYILNKHIASELDGAYALKDLLAMDMPSEYLIYGAYAYNKHRLQYHFVAEGDQIKPICTKVNQIPPTYCHLDPSITYSQFANSHYVVFWSHWNLAESKMIEFFEDSQRDHFGRIICIADRQSLLPPIDSGDFSPSLARHFEGVYSDGWLQKNVRFVVSPPSGASKLRMQLDVPENPTEKQWCLAGTATLGETSPMKDFILQPGSRTLKLDLEGVEKGRLLLVQLELGRGFLYNQGKDGREFRARLRAIGFEDSEIGSGQ